MVEKPCPLYFPTIGVQIPRLESDDSLVLVADRTHRQKPNSEVVKLAALLPLLAGKLGLVSWTDNLLLFVSLRRDLYDHLEELALGGEKLIAREKHLMKKDNEDIYMVTE